MLLNCKTWFSYHYGTYRTEELVEQAAQAGWRALALTNINCTADTWDFVAYCRKYHIRPIAGCEIRNGAVLCYLLLAKNDRGLLEINRFLSSHLHKGGMFPLRPSLPQDDVWVIYPLGAYPPQMLAANELIGVRPSETTRLRSAHTEAYPDKFVVRHPVTFQDKRHYNLHRLLRAIAKNTLLSKLRPEDTASPDELLMDAEALSDHFRAYPAIIARTGEVMESCSVDMALGTDKNKRTFTDSPESDRALLEEKAFQGCVERYGVHHQEAFQRLRKELDVIDFKQFNAYFLIVWDILRFARESGFYHVGRGSGANSMVAYCLRFTDVDPLKLDLYFERFLNPSRTSPPDFDIDFSWQDRDAVINYVFERYGGEHVALLGTYSTYQWRAIVRELGKIFGLPKAEIDALSAKRKPQLDGDHIQRLILNYGELMVGFPHHLSIHAGGMLISEAPIYAYTATELPPKGMPTAQVDMFVAEQVGLVKLDILSQRGLGHIKDALALVKRNRGKVVDIHHTAPLLEDPLLAEKIRTADTIGCFYIESPGMRQLLCKLRCSDYKTLVAASSIIRPGVAQSGMMWQYIERYHDRSKINYLHPMMEELLSETFGVMVYQEDVIKVAHHFAGISLEDADVLRRAMNGKYRSNDHFEQLRRRFFSNCRDRGYAEAVIAEVWRQMESFAGFSFAKGHSASFAVESYQSLYLKTYFPMEFYVAVINNFGGFYRTEIYFHALKRTGARVHAPCLNHSAYLTDIHGEDVYTGFIHVQGLEEQLAKRIVDERNRHGAYGDLQDVIERLQPGMEQLNLLIRCGALRFTGKDKKTLLWQANFVLKKIPRQEVTLFETPQLAFALPEFDTEEAEHALDELELLGFTLHDPYILVDAHQLTDTIHVVDLPHHVGQWVWIVGYLATTKDARTKHGDYMTFGTFLDSRGDWLDTVHFPDTLRRFPFQGNGFYKLYGKVTVEFGVHSVEVQKMRKIGM